MIGRPIKEHLGNQRSKCNQGFTLIEVLIAMAIFSIGILAVANMQILSINQNASARLQTEATTLAVDWMERLLSLPYEDVLLDEAASPFEIQHGSYTLEYSVVEDPDNLGLPIKHIDILVTSANPVIKYKPVALSSIKGKW